MHETIALNEPIGSLKSYYLVTHTCLRTLNLRACSFLMYKHVYFDDFK